MHNYDVLGNADEVARFRISDVKIGDIIVFNYPIFGGCEDRTIIHRVAGWRQTAG